MSITRLSGYGERTHLGHVQVVSDGLPASIVSGLRLDGDSLGGADGFTELAS